MKSSPESASHSAHHAYPAMMMHSNRFRQILWVTTSAVAIAIVTTSIYGSFGLVFRILVPTLAAFSLCFWLIRIHRSNYAVTLFFVTLTILACGLMYSEQGLHDESTIILPAILMFACMFGSGRQFFVLLISLIAFFAMITAGNYWGWHTLQDKNGSDLYTFINVSIILSASGFFAYVLATDLREALEELTLSKQELQSLNEKLEDQVIERTRQFETANLALTESMKNLEHTMKSLAHAERLASLGSMVAGISHELNTPIGNIVLAATTMEELVQKNRDLYLSGQLKRASLHEFLDESEQISTLVIKASQKSANMIASFKRVAVDQTSEQRRDFDLATVVNDNLVAMSPVFKKGRVTVQQSFNESIKMDSFPGPLGQIITNVIQNAVQHGFEGIENGVITISCKDLGDKVQLLIHNDGKIIPQHVISHIFDPFFTTKLGQGGSGLGLSISYRIATSVLGGDLKAESSAAHGTNFILTLPKNAPFAV